jgi:hypothetical protein
MFSGVLFEGRSLIQIKDAETQCPSDHQFGEVSSGFVRLSGKIFPMETSIFYRILEDEDFVGEIEYFSDDAACRVAAEAIWLLPVSHTNNVMTRIFGFGHSDLVCLILEGNGQCDHRPKDYSRVGVLQIRCLEAPADNSNDPEREQPNVLAEALFQYMSKARDEIITII